MRIILDDHELSPFEGGAAEALGAVREVCESQGRIITDVFLDDRRLEQAELDGVVADNPGGEVLRCQSTEPANLVIETFEYVGDALDQIGSMHEATAAHFQAGDMASGLTDLREVLALWNSVRQGVEQGCMLVRLDIDRLRAEASEVDAALTSLATRLDEIKAAVSNQDWSALADTLGYEMQPVVENWHSFVRLLTDRVEALREAGSGG